MGVETEAVRPDVAAAELTVRLVGPAGDAAAALEDCGTFPIATWDSSLNPCCLAPVAATTCSDLGGNGALSASVQANSSNASYSLALVSSLNLRNA